MNALHRILNPIHQLAVKVLGAVSAIILALLVFDVLLGVFTRFVMGSQTRWTEEVAVNLLIWVSLLGAAVAYAEKGHLGLDYLVDKFHPSVAVLTGRVVDLIVFAFALYGLFLGGISLVAQTTNILPALGISHKWVFLSLPVSGAFFMLFSLHSLVAPAGIKVTEETPDSPPPFE